MNQECDDIFINKEKSRRVNLKAKEYKREHSKEKYSFEYVVFPKSETAVAR